MKITGIKLRGVGCFHDEVEVPISELGDAKLVVIVGNNGAGKSTLMETVPGALFRTMPSRGAISALATARDSFAEVRLDIGGQPYTAKLLINGTARNRPTEAYLSNGTGAPLNDGKASTYDAAVAERLPSPEVYFASAFAAQKGDGNFLALPPAQRKELFARLLGLGRLQELSDLAGERLRQEQMRAAELAAAAEVLRTQAGKVDALSAENKAAQRAAADAALARVGAQEASDASQEKAAEWAATATEIDADVARARSDEALATERLGTARRELGVLQDRLAKTTVERLRVGGLAEQRSAYETKAKNVDELRSGLAGAELDLQAVRERNAWLVENAARLREEHRILSDAAKAAAREAEAVVTEQRRIGERIADDIARAEQQTLRLREVPCHGAGEFASCGLIGSATKARDGLAALRAKLTEHDASAKDAADAVSKRVLAALQAFNSHSDEAPAPDTATEKERTAEVRRLNAAIVEASTAAAKLEAIADAEARAAALDAEIPKLRGEAAASEERIAALQAAVSSACDVLAKATRAVEAHRVTKPQTVDHKRLVAEATALERETAAKATRTEEALRAATQALAESAQQQAKIEAAAAEVDDWRALQTALGKDGVQALAIDAAGPDVSALANDLLHACYGSRFTLSLETTALKADGKATKEVFELRVIDTQGGIECSADKLSGGEQVLVSEALALAIAIYNTRKSSIPMLDLFRDESAGALSHENAPRYVEMLRRALDLGGFHRVYFVAHQPHLWPLADRRLVVADGQVRVE